MNTDKHVLLLNTSEEVLSLITWQKAVKLIASGKASNPYNHEDFYEIKVSGNKTYSLSTAIVLERHAQVPYKVAALSRKNIMKRDAYTCQYCSLRLTGTNETLDHIIPQSRGGKHSWPNLVAACKPCNSRKAARTPEEADMKLLRKPYTPTRAMLVDKMVHANKRSSWARWMVT